MPKNPSKLAHALRNYRWENTAMFGMTEPSNIDTTRRLGVENTIPGEGGISTVRSMGVNLDGQEVLIPTVVNGRIVSNEEAIQHYLQTGEHLGKFKTPDESTRYAERLHEEEARRIRKR
jgi:hypothetical protein